MSLSNREKNLVREDFRPLVSTGKDGKPESVIFIHYFDGVIDWHGMDKLVPMAIVMKPCGDGFDITVNEVREDSQVKYADRMRPLEPPRCTAGQGSTNGILAISLKLAYELKSGYLE